MKILKYKNKQGQYNSIGQYKINNVIVSQELGTSQSDVVSQKRVTEEFEAIHQDLNKGIYNISFVEGAIAQEYIPKDMKIVDFSLHNISEAVITGGALVREEIAKRLVIPANTLVTWEITKISQALPSLISIKYEYQENQA